jgi:hypothetical protein
VVRVMRHLEVHKPTGMGGAVPISELFQRHIQLDTVFFSSSLTNEDYHAPNVFFSDSTPKRSARGAWARYWQLLGETQR